MNCAHCDLEIDGEPVRIFAELASARVIRQASWAFHNREHARLWITSPGSKSRLLRIVTAATRTQRPCRTCGATGTVGGNSCTDCGGDGQRDDAGEMRAGESTPTRIRIWFETRRGERVLIAQRIFGTAGGAATYWNAPDDVEVPAQE